jgi:hypothetical protein
MWMHLKQYVVRSYYLLIFIIVSVTDRQQHNKNKNINIKTEQCKEQLIIEQLWINVYTYITLAQN